MHTIADNTFVFQVLKCLEHVHHHNVVHCNIKPTNVAFFISDNSWKLLDIETSAKNEEPSDAIRCLSSYAPPELIFAKEKGQTMIVLETSADMWSFGIMAFEALTGSETLKKAY